MNFQTEICPIDKDVENDLLQEDVLNDSNKLYIQKISEVCDHNINDQRLESQKNEIKIQQSKNLNFPKELKNDQKKKEENAHKPIKVNFQKKTKGDDLIKKVDEYNAVEQLIIEEIKDTKIDDKEEIKDIDIMEKNNREKIIKIKKNLLYEVNNFQSCLGMPGTGKSTFCSYYYQKRYNVEKLIFKPSDSYKSFTKGIWLMNQSEKHKIKETIEREILDVEGFEIIESISWKHTIIITFLSTEVIILNKGRKYDQVGHILKIMEKGLKNFKKQKIPKILKKIYIQYDQIKKFNGNELLKTFNLDEELFEMSNKENSKKIKIEFIYFPDINEDKLEDGQEIIDSPEYIENFENILNILSKTEGKYNAVGSLIEYVDYINESINGGISFNAQTIFKDIEFDFKGVYIRYKNKLKNELLQNIPKLKNIESTKETFEEFIKNKI